MSLGGTGGQLIVGMEGNINKGDSLSVLEVGNCEHADGTAIEDEIEVYVSVSDSETGNWFLLGSGVGPSIDFTIPQTLPDVPAP